MKRSAWVGAFIVLMGPLLAARQDKKPDDKKFGVDLKNVNLEDLTLTVQRFTRKTILWSEELQLRNKRVHFVSDVPIQDNPEALWKAYQSIFQYMDLALVPVGEEGKETYKIVTTTKAYKLPVPMRKEDAPPEDRFVTRVFSLQYVPPRDVHAALIQMATYAQGIMPIDSAGLLLATDYDYNVKRFEEIIKAMDVKRPDIELKMVPLKNALATKVEAMMKGLVQTLITRTGQPRGVLPGGGGGIPGIPGQEAVQVVADERTNSVVLLAEPGRLLQLEEIVRKLDAEALGETSGIYFVSLRHTNALDISKTLNAMYRISVGEGGVPSGGAGFGSRPNQPVGPTPGGLPPPPTPSSGSSAPTGSEPTIVADVRSNSIIIITDRNTYKVLEGIIRRLDQRRPQVLIKATVVEIRASDRFDLGVELSRLENPDGGVRGGGRTNFGLSTIVPNAADNTFSIAPVDTPGITLLLFKDRIGNIGALAHALKGKATVNILDEPEVATNDNGVATIKVTNQVPVLQTNVVGTGFQQTTFSRFETAETSLMISPHISEGQYLRLETTVKIEKFTRESSADPNIPPPKTSREITTKEIMVPNGRTMVIGGIVTQDQSHSIQGVPLLQDIPILGLFFSRRQEEMDKRTLYIFLTPYITYDYSFADYGEETRRRKEDIERLRGEALRGLNVDPKAERLPKSTFQYQPPRHGGTEEPQSK